MRLYKRLACSPSSTINSDLNISVKKRRKDNAQKAITEIKGGRDEKRYIKWEKERGREGGGDAD